ncbi:hypothetical protein S7711_01657 [Stachybotrys chartarum IBT 7711]|uniref:Sugar phosphate phosphatase n=1 Tax=Stachybotrys chartarum (strain CBS 109288 / IBT 7711) TaxID=1280523 RepID=A0A084AV71_STACB|nr:hypothetical protein S7711_01657 [Stachybotrys chartarum IBT 7711]KFA53799.1 hypothetical protein S40293_01684 [Stachybotrys chartarum IBT 40293]
MEHDTKTPQYDTADPTSFAHASVRQRWPAIIDGAVGDVSRSVAESEDADKQAEGESIVEQLKALKERMMSGAALTCRPLEDDGFPDEVGSYNRELSQLGDPPNWHNVPWLFSECYMYRFIHSLFLRTSHWKRYDVFARQKINGFKDSRVGVIELAARYKELIEGLRKQKDQALDPDAEKTLFAEMFDICLWGNATDLSLLTTLTQDDIQRLQGAKARKAAEKNILANDTQATYDLLEKARASGDKDRRVDIVLDNAGFELYADLIMAGYLLASGLATRIVLHPKSIPWFVSDVMPNDFAGLLNALANSKATFGESEALSEKELQDLSFVFQDWATYHGEGQLLIRANRYWTSGGSFWRLPYEAKELYEDLKTSKLVIFKGDLNYRKLTADAQWDPTTPFSEAIGSLGPKSGLNVLSLRTCKADVVVGLKPGQDEELKATEGGGGDSGARKWAWSGKWAVISLSKAE